MKTKAKGILFVSAGDPWSEWTWSGVYQGLCHELNKRGVLAGAISPTEPTARHLRGPAALYSLEHRLLHKVRYYDKRRNWNSEKEGVVGKVLRRLPAGSAVIYSCLTPEPDPTLNLRRYRFMDVSVFDAVRTGSYAFGGFTKEQLEAKAEEERRSFHWCDGILSLSTHAGRRIHADLGYPLEKIIPVGAGPGVRIEPVPPPALDRYARGEVLMVGRDWERKGGPMLLEAFRRVRAQLPHVKLKLVGFDNPPTGEGIEAIGLINKGTAAGRRRLAEVFAGASVYCMPSVCECWGLVYVEAAMAGLPIVGLDNWAMPDLVADGVSGTLVSDHSPEALAMALHALLSSPERMLAMGLAAQKRVEDVLDWPHVADRVLHMVMPEALEGRKPMLLQNKGRGWTTADKMTQMTQAYVNGAGAPTGAAI